MDKLLDMADAAGIKYYVDTDNKSYWPYTEFPRLFSFCPAGTLLCAVCWRRTSKRRGLRFFMNTGSSIDPEG